MSESGKWLVFGGVPLFDIFDLLVENILLFTSSLILALFVFFGMKKENYMDELCAGHGEKTRVIANISYYLTVFVAPVCIALLLFEGFKGFIGLWV